jgi:hypothetical protein
MQEVADWLEELGMSEYAQRFSENDIDFEVLGELTDADFDRLGVSIGHRRKLLKALAAGIAPTTAEAPPSESTTESAEHRQVTVMFSDLVGSTAPSARIDSEDLRELISAYQKCVAETVQRLRRLRSEVQSASSRGRCRESGTRGPRISLSSEWAGRAYF